MNSYNDPIAVRGRFACPACSARFHTVGEKKQHVRTEHADTRKKS